MKVAVTIWNGRISPVFDAAGRILVAEISGGREVSRQEHGLPVVYPPLRIRLLESLGVDVIICGAISNPVAALIETAGIKLLPWVSGNTENVLRAFKEETLEGPQFLMPGCGGKRCRRGWGGDAGRGAGMRDGRGGRGGGRGGRGQAGSGEWDSGRGWQASGNGSCPRGDFGGKRGNGPRGPKPGNNERGGNR